MVPENCHPRGRSTFIGLLGSSKRTVDILGLQPPALFRYLVPSDQLVLLEAPNIDIHMIQNPGIFKAAPRCNIGRPYRERIRSPAFGLRSSRSKHWCKDVKGESSLPSTFLDPLMRPFSSPFMGLQFLLWSFSREAKRTVET